MEPLPPGELSLAARSSPWAKTRTVEPRSHNSAGPANSLKPTPIRNAISPRRPFSTGGEKAIRAPISMKVTVIRYPKGTAMSSYPQKLLGKPGARRRVMFPTLA